MDEDDELPDFSWQPRGRAWWMENKSLARASELQLRFAAAFERCGHQARAAAEAGYSGNKDTLRQAGSRARHSRAVVTLLGLAAAEDGDGDEVVDIAELKKILSRAVRTGSTSDKVRGGECLMRLEELSDRRRERSMPKTPKEILAELQKVDEFIARYFAKKYYNADLADVLRDTPPAAVERDDESDSEEPEVEAATA